VKATDSGSEEKQKDWKSLFRLYIYGQVVIIKQLFGILPKVIFIPGRWCVIVINRR
jgi:hypothetical protein